MIIKVQCDSFGEQVLMYDQSRTVFCQLNEEQSRSIIEELDLECLTKQYWSAKLTEGGKLYLHERVEDQAW